MSEEKECQCLACMMGRLYGKNPWVVITTDSDGKVEISASGHCAEVHNTMANVYDLAIYDRETQEEKNKPQTITRSDDETLH